MMMMMMKTAFFFFFCTFISDDTTLLFLSVLARLRMVMTLTVQCCSEGTMLSCQFSLFKR